MITELDCDNADRDLTSQVTVLTHTPSASSPMLCVAYIALGDGAKDLDGTGGYFELVITVGGQTVEPSPQLIECSTATRVAFWTSPFPVPAGDEVIIKLTSPNAADTDVDVTASLYDCDPAEVHTIKAALANSRIIDEETGVDKIKEDDGATTLRTLTPVADITLAGANWTNATKRITEAGAFTNYIWESGDLITLTAGTGVVTGQYTISAKIDANTIELSEDINGAGGDIGDSSVEGVISNGHLMVTAS